MTLSIALVLLILIGAALLFVTEWLPVDLVALLILVALALTGLVTPAEALSGFSNPAVVTVWAMFIISGALARTGVASSLGARLLRVAGTGERRLMAIVMLTAGILSGVMNNVGVAALLLPVVMDLTRRLTLSPSRLLIPLAYGCLLGGLTTLIGTPPNLLISDSLRDAGLDPFALFDFAWAGVPIMLAGIAFTVLAGRRLLPNQPPQPAPSDRGEMARSYDLRSTLFTLRVPSDSPVVGQSLAELGLGSILGLTVIGIERNGKSELAPTPEHRLQAGDRLIIEGRESRLGQLSAWQQLVATNDVEEEGLPLPFTDELAEVKVGAGSAWVGHTVEGNRIRERYGVMVMALRRGGHFKRTQLHSEPLQAGDLLLLQGERAQIEVVGAETGIEALQFLTAAEATSRYQLQERMLRLRLPAGATLVGQSLRESRLGDALDLMVLAILRDGAPLHPQPDVRLQAGDALVVKGRPELLAAVRALLSLELGMSAPRLRDVESASVGLAEVVLSPHSSLVGKTLHALHFRQKYGLSVLAIFRAGRAYHTVLRDRPLQFGDALLLYGPRERVKILAAEPDYLPLTESVQESPRRAKAPVAVAILVAILLPVLFGWLHISIAAVAGAALMVALGCLTMEEAYRYIEWKAVFLIAGMLPLGIAMQQSGAAAFLANGMVGLVGGLGMLAVISGLFWLTTLATQVMPNPAVAVLMAPIALTSATELGASPYSLMMVIAIAASASFLSPVAHPANVLVMAPGGYRFSDYIRVGMPLTLLVWLLTLLLVPRIWG
ncbi:MAG: SLC13 family permease [Anaerolineales bacterium]|nr:SLC13 family permease [Anaerolineales bacterium]MCB9128205.1 SLC13 family permease [Ardenticatenales bacterium]